MGASVSGTEDWVGTVVSTDWPVAGGAVDSPGVWEGPQAVSRSMHSIESIVNVRLISLLSFSKSYSHYTSETVEKQMKSPASFDGRLKHHKRPACGSRCSGLEWMDTQKKCTILMPLLLQIELVFHKLR